MKHLKDKNTFEELKLANALLHSKAGTSQEAPLTYAINPQRDQLKLPKGKYTFEELALANKILHSRIGTSQEAPLASVINPTSNVQNDASQFLNQSSSYNEAEKTDVHKQPNARVSSAEPRELEDDEQWI